jgi:hypothetical protein
MGMASFLGVQEKPWPKRVAGSSPNSPQVIHQLRLSTTDRFTTIIFNGDNGFGSVGTG